MWPKCRNQFLKSARSGGVGVLLANWRSRRVVANMGETGLGCAEVAFRCEMVPGDPVQQPLRFPRAPRQRQRVRVL